MKNKDKTLSIIAMGLLVVLFVLQLLPFWSFEGNSASIQSYVWFPHNHEAINSYIASQVGGNYQINDMMIMPVLVAFATVIGVAMGAWQKMAMWVNAIPLLGGIIGVWGYFSHPALRMGSGWVLQLLVSVATVVVAVMAFVAFFKNRITYRTDNVPDFILSRIHNARKDRVWDFSFLDKSFVLD